jgi:hypothetical protein
MQIKIIEAFEPLITPNGPSMQKAIADNSSSLAVNNDPLTNATWDEIVRFSKKVHEDLKREDGIEMDDDAFELEAENAMNEKYEKDIQEMLSEKFHDIKADELFTLGNYKIGKDTIIFNLQPARFCPAFKNGMCQVLKRTGKKTQIACYAVQDERQYQVCLRLRIDQMRYWETHSAEEIFAKLKEYYNKHNPTNKNPKKKQITEKRPIIQYIRFNQSGDLKDDNDMKKMNDVAILAKKELKIISYTYTARYDLLEKYKDLFTHVHVCGSGFPAITAQSKPNKFITGNITPKTLGKIFKAFPSKYTISKKNNSSHLRTNLNPKTEYYEDLPLIKDYHKEGWFECPGNCRGCMGCKSDLIKYIACKIHRNYSDLPVDWYEVSPEGKVSWEDPFVRDGEGIPQDFTPKMQAEVDVRRAEVAKKRATYKGTPEQVIAIRTTELLRYYKELRILQKQYKQNPKDFYLPELIKNALSHIVGQVTKIRNISGQKLQQPISIQDLGKKLGIELGSIMSKNKDLVIDEESPLMEKSKREKDWIVTIYTGEEEVDRWLILNRTENEAFEIASLDVQSFSQSLNDEEFDTFDWTIRERTGKDVKFLKA